MQLDGGLCIFLYCPIESHRIFLDSNCIVMPCSVPVNCPAKICLPFMPCCLSKESTSSELYMDPGPIFTIDTSFTVTCLLAANHYLPHHMFNPLLQQTGELDNLTVYWGKVLSLCCAGLHVACNTCVTFPSSLWFDNLGLNRGKTCCLLLHT